MYLFYFNYVNRNRDDSVTLLVGPNGKVPTDGTGEFDDEYKDDLEMKKY